jgi:hypothetical protein
VNARSADGIFRGLESGFEKLLKKPVDGVGDHPYMAPHSGGRGLLRKVSVRFAPSLVGITDARNESNRGRKRVGSLTLSV